jgi:prevent-host-death family protein
MLTVGIKELKAKLSRYIEQAHSGEEIVVTDHGREVAMVIPISPERRAVKRLGDEGFVRWEGGKPRGQSGIAVHGKTLTETVLEERR